MPSVTLPMNSLGETVEPITEELIIGRCTFCNKSFDRYTFDRSCTVCNALLLVCDSCFEELDLPKEVHCEKHR